MRVLMVNRFFYPFLGGVEFHILNLSNCLGALGCEVSVACKTSDGAPPRERWEGIDIRRVGGPLGISRVVDEGFDVVHAHMPRNVFSFAGLWLADRAGVASVLTPHCFYPSRAPAMRLAKAAWDRVATRAMFGWADATISLTPSDQADAIARGLPPGKSHVIPNSIRVDRLEGTKPTDFRRCYDLPERFLLHVGRFDPVKHIEFLVRAHQSVPGIGLALVGQPGPSSGPVAALVDELGLRDRVRVIERASLPDLCGAYRQAAALVMGSSSEGLPTVILEALYFGCPVVATRVGGIPFVLDRAVLGATFAVGDAAGYLAAVDRAVAAGRAGAEERRAHVVAGYSWESNARRVFALYEQLVASRLQRRRG